MRQYQLAIVEDEPHTARYIQGIVEATNLFHIAAVCESAEELLTLEPFPDLDVLVTDVKMSGLTGLELLRELQTRLPQLCSIIISGYDSFEYARDAIRLNVSNYILKPISKDELTVALLHLYDQLSNLRQKSGEEYLNSLYQEGEQPLEQALSLPAPYYHVLMAAGMNDQNQLILRCRTLLALEKHPELQMCIYQYGFLILLGVAPDDTEEKCRKMADKLCSLRIFDDENDKINLSLDDVGGELLVVSQFTLYGNCRKGRRPEFLSAARPEIAIPMYEKFVEICREKGYHVETGEFGAYMEVESLNDGPFTLIVDSADLDAPKKQ